MTHPSNWRRSDQADHATTGDPRGSPDFPASENRTARAVSLSVMMRYLQGHPDALSRVPTALSRAKRAHDDAPGLAHASLATSLRLV